MTESRRQSAIALLKTLLAKAEDPEDNTFDHLRLGQYLTNCSPYDLYYAENEVLSKKIETEDDK